MINLPGMEEDAFSSVINHSRKHGCIWLFMCGVAVREVCRSAERQIGRQRLRNPISSVIAFFLLGFGTLYRTHK